MTQYDDLLRSLKACPFCGGKGKPNDTDAPVPEMEDLYWIECDECGAQGQPCESPFKAIARWNSRSHEDRLQSRVEALESERNKAFADAGKYVEALKRYRDPANWRIVKDANGTAYAVWTGDLYPRGIAEIALQP